jgi:hypothetical protein
MKSMKYVEIYTSLSNNTSLTVLWLVDNELGVGTGGVMNSVLTKNKTLRWVNL